MTEEQTQHTPGPWRLADGYQEGDRIGTIDGTIAIIVRRTDQSGRGIPADRQTANARLIAVAPDLLAALQTVADTLRPQLDGEAKDVNLAYLADEVVRPALARARGGD